MVSHENTDLDFDREVAEEEREVHPAVDAIACVDVTHAIVFDGGKVYRARLRAGLSRRMFVERLADAGVRMTVGDVRRLEEAAEDSEPSASEIVGIARALGTQVGGLYCCWTCVGARLGWPERTEGCRTDIRLGGERIRAVRRARGLSPLAAARLAHVERRDAVDIERGRGGRVGITAILAYLDLLEIDDVSAVFCPDCPTCRRGAT